MEYKNDSDMSYMLDNCILLLFVPNLLQNERNSFNSNSRYSDFINDYSNTICSDDGF